MLKRILIAWLTSQIVGPPRSLRQTARRSVRRKVTNVSDTACAELAAMSEGWTGRNLRDLINVAAELADDGLDADAALREACAIYTPKLRDVQQMTQLALAEISDLRLVPPQYRQQVRAAQDAPAEPEPVTRRRRGEGGVL